MAETVEHRVSGEHRIGVRAHVGRARAARQIEHAMQHLHIEAGQRKVRPCRSRRHMEEDDPALALLRGGDERRAVGQSRPGVFAQLDRRFGQHLARHRHFPGNGKAAERTRVGEGRQMLRLGPGERAAEIAAAATQLHRNEIVHILRHARAGETHQHAAIGHEFGDRVVIGARDAADIRQHQHAGIARQRFVHGAFGDVGKGRERAFQIEEIGE